MDKLGRRWRWNSTSHKYEYVKQKKKERTSGELFQHNENVHLKQLTHKLDDVAKRLEAAQTQDERNHLLMRQKELETEYERVRKLTEAHIL